MAEGVKIVKLLLVWVVKGICIGFGIYAVRRWCGAG